MASGCEEMLESDTRRDTDIRKSGSVRADLSSMVVWHTIGIHSDNPISERMWNVHRADYQRVLYDAAVKRGVVVRFDSRVESLDEDGPSVTIKGGEIVKGDVIVGADGKLS